ncbi:DUF6879 family protein [Streptomyces sp. NPDC048462]|uniref:DUF6879 family protein n=1 Tax=Streptomyces sp. NPDC048462 TaxID=3365555 RepID=UPI003710AE4F
MARRGCRGHAGTSARHPQENGRAPCTSCDGSPGPRPREARPDLPQAQWGRGRSPRQKRIPRADGTRHRPAAGRPARTGARRLRRYLLDNAERNCAVGEDIRYLWRADADRLGLPCEDAWLFDSRVIALLHVDVDDELTGVELVTEPAQVARACQVRDAAWHFGTPYRAFSAEVPPGM